MSKKIRKNIVALIPARSGSKRIKNKNIKLLNGHPLIAYTIQSAINSEVFDEVIVSTDSKDIKKISEYYGAYVPFLRPSIYATDTSPDIEFVKHALEELSKLNKNYSQFSILRPTSPFRKARTIKRAFKLFSNSESDSLRAVEKCLQHPCKMWTLDGEFIKPFVDLGFSGPHNQPLHSSQYPSLPEVLVQNASLEIANSNVIFEQNNISGSKIIPFFTKDDEGIDVNVEEDWIKAEIYLKSEKATLPKIFKKPFKN
ncbi:MAG: acylneuraminate cytidylyltransferase [Chloroflexi bacterium]|nr:acylneuraminate cytidylyltransferase [Chloroflexota bacterium]